MNNKTVTIEKKASRGDGCGDYVAQFEAGGVDYKFENVPIHEVMSALMHVALMQSCLDRAGWRS
ncbi:MAG: hypothetical protein GY847_14430 [Proteobacteria bacterium]|nr:hypothetical protein [Pseudomonadota bacterium]